MTIHYFLDTTIPILQAQKLQFIEIRELAQGPIASNAGQRQSPVPGSSDKQSKLFLRLILPPMARTSYPCPDPEFVLMSALPDEDCELHGERVHLHTSNTQPCVVHGGRER